MGIFSATINRASRDTASTINRISKVMDAVTRFTEPQTVDVARMGMIETEARETQLPDSNSCWVMALTDEEVSSALQKLLDSATQRVWTAEPGKPTARGKSDAAWLTDVLNAWGSQNKGTFQTLSLIHI